MVVPKTGMVGIVKMWIPFVISIVYLCCFAGTANTFTCQPSTSYTPTTEQKFDPKWTLFQTSFNDLGGDSSDKTSNYYNNSIGNSVRKQDEKKTVLTSCNAQRHKIILPGDSLQTTPLLDRRTMASVATERTMSMIFGGGITSTILTKSLPSQAATTLASIGENREKVPFISSVQALPSDNDHDHDNVVVDLPLEYIPTLGAYVVRYFLFGEVFAAIVDTGSPFLTVPYYCKPYRNQKMFWGCYKPELTLDSGYGNTIEGFDNNYGTC